MRSKKFAVTGGIGSGKSVVCRILKERGYPVYSCDDISRALWQREEYRRELATAFPSCAEEGLADKAKVASLVFSDAQARRALEAIAHPRIMQELISSMEEHPVAFAEVPLLFEGGFEDLFDGAILVMRPEQVRIEAVKQRDGLSEEEVRARIAAQIPDEGRGGKALFAIDNSGGLAVLEEKVSAALRFFGVNR